MIARERIVNACNLGPAEALKLLDRAQAGEHDLLTDWVVYSMYTRLIKLGAPRPRALLTLIDLGPKLRIDVQVT